MDRKATVEMIRARAREIVLANPEGVRFAQLRDEILRSYPEPPRGTIEERGEGRYFLRYLHGARPGESKDADSSRVTWQAAGVHQNLTFPVHPDPLSGMHCWHQKVRIERAHAEDRYGDVCVDTRESWDVYRAWMARTRPAPGPGGPCRPRWLGRPFRPDPQAYVIGP